MKHTPYTTKTGIQIGSRYQENGITLPVDDPDMVYLQEALLATPDYIRSKRWHNRSVALSMAGLIFLMFYFVLFR